MSAWADLSHIHSIEARPWRASAVAAFAAHALLLLAAGRVFFTPVTFGVESGLGGIDVQLVAAPAETPKASVLALEPAPERLPADPASMEISMPRPEQPAAPSAPAQAPAKQTDARGDGSSAIPGRDAVTISSAGGAQSARPHYLSNPAPQYPEAARQAGQEGLVLLEVTVSTEGRAEKVDLRESSGHPSLDRAAREAVRKWRFQPARFGASPVRSVAEVPVRFRLDEAR